MRRCNYCGKILHELPYTCRQCGFSFCSDHHLPENHKCPIIHSGRKPIWSGLKGSERTSRLRIDTRPIRHYWYILRNSVTLKNFTILSLLLMLVGLIPSFYPINNFQSILLSALEIGILCFLLAYFLYAAKCWGSGSQISAVLMLTLPLTTYFLSTNKIPDSTTGIIFEVFLKFCWYAILSVIVLWISEKIITGINRHILKNRKSFRWYFHPDANYIFFGIIFLSAIVVIGGNPGIWSSNVNSMVNSVSSNVPVIPSTTPTLTTTYQQQPIATPIKTIVVLSKQFTSLEDSKKSIDYINSLRASYGLSALQFDSRVYYLGLARVNDMDEYGYLDHTNPQTGTCPDSIKTRYGLSTYEYVAENAYGYSSSTGMNYYVGIENDAIDSWMTSRGHRYNLLYPHTGGAVACSNGGHCVFLGLNGNRFGEGCYTAAQGRAIWNTVGKQPNEI